MTTTVRGLVAAILAIAIYVGVYGCQGLQPKPRTAPFHTPPILVPPAHPEGDEQIKCDSSKCWLEAKHCCG